jgi:uncharacterized protein (TIGR03435 family)
MRSIIRTSTGLFLAFNFKLNNFDARTNNTDAGPGQIRAMVQTLLADRFKLAAHREAQQSQVYTLIVGKSGTKMEQVTDGRRAYINWTGPGQLTLTGPIEGLINVLSSN